MGPATGHGNSSASAEGAYSVEAKEDENLGVGLVDASGNWRNPSETTSALGQAPGSADDTNNRHNSNSRNNRSSSDNSNSDLKHATPSSSLGVRRAVDFCEACFQRLGREHVAHHFLRSEANGDLAAANSGR